MNIPTKSELIWFASGVACGRQGTERESLLALAQFVNWCGYTMEEIKHDAVATGEVLVASGVMSDYTKKGGNDD